MADRMAADIQTQRQWLQQRVSTPEFREFLAELLFDLCRLDTIPTRNIPDTAQREGELLDLIQGKLARYAPAGHLERRPIPDSISAHPFYTFPHYAGTAEVYSERRNLLYLWDAPVRGQAGQEPLEQGWAGQGSQRHGTGGIAVNAHIDTVAPYFSPRREGEQVFGRGACDDKGGCAVMIATLRLLRELEQRFAVCAASDLTFMFVIDEEMGGNGSLALAQDEQLSDRYATLAVLECCSGQIHPAGRGAVWYRVEIPAFRDDPPGPLSGYNPVLLALEIIRGMDREGAAIRLESEHPLFCQTAVQTSPGILGPFGEHPARVCASVVFILSGCNGEVKLEPLEAVLKTGLQEYIRRYGDKTGGFGSGLEFAGLRRHYTLRPTESGEIELRVHGLSGHMGALFENDNALIKAAYLLEPLKFAEKAGEESWKIRLAGRSDPSLLLLEGGQGFVPTHSMEQIKSRLNAAAQRAYRRYARSTWRRLPYFRDTTPRMSFAKLHNEAFQCDPASPAVAEALLAAEAAGVEVRRPPVGWEVSSDARIFAHLRPDLTVFTTGPGKLSLAHADQERITIDELSSSTLMLILFLLGYGGFQASSNVGPSAKESRS